MGDHRQPANTVCNELRTSFAGGWRPMLVVHAAVLVVVAAILGPLASAAVRGLVMLSGQKALSDTAIAGFLLGPPGAVAGLVIGSMALVLGLLGYAALLIPARQAWRGQTASPWSALTRVGRLLPSLLQLAARFILRLLLVALPFAAAIGLIYLLLLGEHDINYYLAEKPPAFLAAVALAAICGAGLAWMLIRVGCDWFHALPLVLLAGCSPRDARRESKRAVSGQRREISLSLALWLLGTPLLTGLLNLPAAMLGRWLVPVLAEQLGILALVLGLLVLAGTVVSFVTSFAAISLLAIQHVRLFEKTQPAEPAPPAARTEARRRRIGFVLIAAALAVVSLTTWITYRWLDRLVVERHVEVIAHRGASAAAPENTMAAVRLAIEQGADWVEIDVQLTATGEVLVFHDRDFKRVAKRALDLRDARPEDLAEIDIGSWFDPKFSAERTPTLREVLDTCRGRCGVLIELKYYGEGGPLEQRVVEEVERAGMVDEVRLMSLDQNSVRKIRKLRPEWKVGLLSSVALGDLTRLDVDFLGLNGRAATPGRIRRARESGIDVYVWTVNDPVEMSAMISRGATGLITDEPGRARTVIMQRAELNPSARLLLEISSRLGGRPSMTEAQQ
jgi:glycerophosphoryl diester phosphodiesterase